MKEIKLCPKCGVALKDINSKMCRACYLANPSKGKDLPWYKGGKPKCKECGKECLDYNSSVCRACYLKQDHTKINAPNWKGGKARCMDCGVELGDYSSLRCKPCRGKTMLGENNPSWNGGVRLDEHGYKMIYKPEHPNATKSGYIPEHRMLAADALGRPLTEDEVVHHKDENKQNNSLDNLEVLTKSQHMKHHGASYKRLTKEQERQLIADYLSGESSINLGRKFSVSPTTVTRLVRLAGHGDEIERRTPLTLTSEERLEVIRLYSQGFSSRDLAVRFGVTPKSIQSLLKSRGVSLRGPGNHYGNGLKPILTQDQIEEILLLYKEGISAGELAKGYGVSSVTIYYHLKRHGIT